MKKIIAILLICLAANFGAKAQYVTLADTNFRNILMLKYPTCFNSAKQMDTTNSLIVNEDSLRYFDSWGGNLDGLQYFKNIQSLDISGGVTYHIPSFPRRLKHIYCGGLNQLDSLPILPDSLTYLDCNFCDLHHLPPLPNTLLYLNCAHNNFTFSYPQLFPVFPNSLIYLDCNFCNQPGMAPLNFQNIPSSLQYLNCSYNYVTNLPSLPNSLTYLDCHNNDIHCLPQLPNALTTLWVDTSKIHCLPNIPSGITTTLPICNATNNPNNCPILTQPNYVNIPDTNFGSLLLAKYPGCLYKDNANKYWMDTTCSAIVNEDSLHFFDYWGGNLDGLQYFKNIQSLDISGGATYHIPSFPRRLKHIYCSGLNQLDSLPILPDSLTYLDCSNSYLRNLPPLPNTLLYLDCSGNFFSGYLPHLFQVFPNSLIYLDCQNSNFPVMMPLNIQNIPSSLQYLNCSRNNVTNLPSLPSSLTYLDCSSNDIHCLSQLPNALTTLGVDTSKIHCLPNIPSGITTTLPICNATNNPNNCTILTVPAYVNIPDSNFGKFLLAKYPSCLYKDASNLYWMDTTCSGVVNEDSLICSNKNIASLDGVQYFASLKYLNCSNNNIDSLPNLPNTLKSLGCSHNKLLKLPTLPINLISLNCENNLLTNLPTLPDSLRGLSCSFNSITSLPTLPDSLYSLYCYNTQLSNLPTLPNNLSYLRCFKTNITCIPNIPTGTFFLQVDTSKVHCLPDFIKFPGNVQHNTSFMNIGQLAFLFPCNYTNNKSNCPNSNYVNIPDTNFGKFLIAKYPSCLYKDFSNLYWMDTTCSGVVNADSILYNGFPLADSKKIQNLQGVQYFTNLKYLDVTKNLLYSIPNLPKTLQYLNTNFNSNIVSLPVLPNALISLNCYQNALTSLPQLPNSLQSLDVLGNNLSVLPTLPNSLLYLRTYGNPLLTCLPLLPASLADLYTDVPCIPNKPVTLLNAGNTPPPPVCNATNNPNNCTFIPANYVNIPDTSFGKFLLSQYPSCLYKDASNLYWMDTTCGGVVNETSLFCAFKNVKNLYGVQYFKRVKTLYCANNPITTIPSLPDSVTTFSCFNDSLVSLPNLPNGLKQLNCYNNKLTSLPLLSDSLVSIDCHNNSITILPALTNKLQTVNCSKNSLGGLPALPASLFNLDCSNNPIGSLPTLPIHLLRLYCNANSLNSLPVLPSSLDWLECSSNVLTSLPALPTYLSYLGCSNNQLTSIPTIYNTLDSIKCDHNLLTSLPTLTHALRLIDCSNNANLGCLPKLPSLLKKLNIVNTQINCLPNVINGLVTTPNLPYCNPTNNANQCQAFPTIQGKVFTDNNSNGAKDTLEFYRPFVKLSLNNGQSTFTNLTGSYNINIDTLGSFTLKVTPPPYFKAVPDSVNFSFSAGTTLLVLPDIALQPIAVKDSIAAYVTTLHQSAVPGLNLAYNITYGNAGTTNLKPTVNFNFDSSRLIFDSSSVAIINNSGNVISVSSDSLFAGQIKYFNLYFKVKTTAVLGDSIATLLNIAAAATVANAINVVVVHSSFDPNDKQATPTLTPQQVSNGEYIDYVIRFQNTGNANANNIVISDTLSNLLQYNNIQVVTSSNNNNISYSVGNGIIYFQFLNINLPYASANEPLSHGFVRFRVKALPTLALGAIVPNTASIYFDYNTPIVTNTATTIIKAVTVPVRIVSYTINFNEKREIKNDWKVGVEVNVSHYIVQRSINGKDFIGVGEVAAQSLNSYSFIDKVSNDILQNTLYYRLKIIDKDEIFTYSDIKQITKNEKRETISMYPNPARDIVNIDVLGGKQLSIIDYLGKEVVSQSVVNKQQISIINLAKGVYMVKLIMNNGEAKASKLIIE